MDTAVPELLYGLGPRLAVQYVVYTQPAVTRTCIVRSEPRAEEFGIRREFVLAIRASEGGDTRHGGEKATVVLFASTVTVANMYYVIARNAGVDKSDICMATKRSPIPTFGPGDDTPADLTGCVKTVRVLIHTTKISVGNSITCLTQQIMAHITREGPPMRSALQCLGRCGRHDDQLVNKEMCVYLDMTSRSGVGPDKDRIKWTTSNIRRCRGKGTYAAKINPVAYTAVATHPSWYWNVGHVNHLEKVKMCGDGLGDELNRWMWHHYHCVPVHGARGTGSDKVSTPSASDAVPCTAIAAMQPLQQYGTLLAEVAAGDLSYEALMDHGTVDPHDAR